MPSGFCRGPYTEFRRIGRRIQPGYAFKSDERCAMDLMPPSGVRLTLRKTASRRPFQSFALTAVGRLRPRNSRRRSCNIPRRKRRWFNFS
jgi:hypothetical protein